MRAPFSQLQVTRASRSLNLQLFINETYYTMHVSSALLGPSESKWIIIGVPLYLASTIQANSVGCINLSILLYLESMTLN